MAEVVVQMRAIVLFLKRCERVRYAVASGAAACLYLRRGPRAVQVSRPWECGLDPGLHVFVSRRGKIYGLKWSALGLRAAAAGLLS